MFSAEPVCSCASFSTCFAHETAGAARIRHSLLPHLGDNETQTSGTSCRENADVYPLFENLSARRPGQASTASADPGPIRRGGDEAHAVEWPSPNDSRRWLWVPAQGRDDERRELRSHGR